MEIEINRIKDTFFSILDDYKKYYVDSKKNPEVDEYQNFYLESKSQLQKMDNDLLRLSKEIEGEIEDLDKKKENLIKNISFENLKKERLEELLKGLKSTEKGAKYLINDTSDLYINQYYKNVELIIGIVIISYIIYNL